MFFILTKQGEQYIEKLAKLLKQRVIFYSIIIC